MTQHSSDIGSREHLTIDRFREAMSRLCAPVNVVTTAGSAGLSGATVTAVSSVTDTPPTLLVCVNRNAYSNAIIRENGTFCVNVLRAGQEAVSDLFAGRGKIPAPERFAHVTHHFGTSGNPILTDALVAFECKLSEMMDIGTHTIFIGEVVDLSLSCDEVQAGLMYFARRYTEISPA